MAAYASVISLKHTINGLLNSSSSSSSSCREKLGFAYDEVTSLQHVLERLNESSRSKSRMKRVDALEDQIRDWANILEDFLELMDEEVQEVDEEVIDEIISSFGKTAKKASEDYMEELSRDEDEDDEDNDDEDAAINDVSGVCSSSGMVGRSEEFTEIREHLLGKMRPDDLYFYSFLGEKGGGRAKIANSVYEDLSKSRGEYFDCWAWMTVEHQQLKQVLISIIAQVVDHHGDSDISRLDESELSKYLHRGLENRRYMIVLDDVDDAELVDILKRTSLPDQSNGSLVLITTASNEVSQLADNFCLCKLPHRYFQEGFWPPLRTFLLDSQSNIIPPEIMEEAGTKIIQNCCCRLVAAAKTYLFLSKTDKTVEEWRKIAADVDNPIFMVTDELSEISKIKEEVQTLDMSDQRNTTTTRNIA